MSEKRTRVSPKDASEKLELAKTLSAQLSIKAQTRFTEKEMQ